MFPSDKEHTNSLGQQLARIEPGAFTMGVDSTPLPESIAGLPHRRFGDHDEQPVHTVHITQPFYMAAYPLRNAVYEQFEPDHAQLRGKLGFSRGDDEAVVFISWHDAVRFCDWLSEKEGLPYRLPTEAEWEYACRAGTTTPYHTGMTLHENFLKNQRRSWYPDPRRSGREDIVTLRTTQKRPNPWGLWAMHGLVEEWCLDWYGPYEEHEQEDPVGRASGEFRVTRGGSHSTELFYLRSANRMAALPDERSWLIGFRPVLGPMPATKPLPPPPLPMCLDNVQQERPPDIETAPPSDRPYYVRPQPFVRIPLRPYYAPPLPFVHIPPRSIEPIFAHHNHVPAITECPNGDLFACWYTCIQEPGRETTLAGSRRRYGEDEWEPASVFWDPPDRTTGSSLLWRDGDRIRHFIGLSAAATWGSIAVVMRTSDDSGATWSTPRYIVPEHGVRHMPIESAFRAQDGTMVLACDAVADGQGGTALWLSDDDGDTWHDAGGTIAGIHAGVTQLLDGRLLAFGRNANIDGMMPQSISNDMGRTWTYCASPFPPVRGSQRVVLKRLREGPLFFASFANEPMSIKDATGSDRPIAGLYCAVSFDDGATWPIRRLVSDDGPGRLVETMDGRFCMMSKTTSERAGYLASCQGANGLIHLISSRLHHTFNLAWLSTPAPGL